MANNSKSTNMILPKIRIWKTNWWASHLQKTNQI